ncbi:MAG: hypothetical protein ACKVQB_08540, partial [Bacteroidia bacterium]
IIWKCIAYTSMFARKKNMKKLILATFVISCGLWACKSKTDETPVIKTLCDSVTYSTMVKPILTTSCTIAGCHNGVSGSGGGIDLRTYTLAKAASQNKEMKKAINHQLGGSRNMPMGAPKLSQRNINIIECWMDKGYVE